MECCKCKFIEEGDLVGWRIFYGYKLGIKGEDEQGYFDLCPFCTDILHEYFKEAISKFFYINNKKELMENIKPLYDYIVFKRIEKEEKSSGGVILTNKDENRNIQYGEVLAVGSGRKTECGKLAPLEVKVGDTIICAKYGGTDIGGDKFLLKEDHIFAVISEIS